MTRGVEGFLEPRFGPYQIYKHNLRAIEDFTDMTQIAYALREMILAVYPKSSLPEPKVSPDMEAGFSFAPGDITHSVAIKRGWVSLDHYARLEGLSLDEVEQQAHKGELGPVQIEPKTGAEVVMWPPEEQAKPLNELPRVGHGEVDYIQDWRKTGRIASGLDQDDGVALLQRLLYFAHEVGDPAEVTEQSVAMLLRSCFLLSWTVFEAFIKDTLIHLNPHYAADGTAHPGGSDEDAIDSIADAIRLLRANHKSHSDPYSTWYVVDGKEYHTKGADLREIRFVRNAIVHRCGALDDWVFKKFRRIPRRDNLVNITHDYYLETQLILKAIAANIARMIDSGEMSPR